MEQEATKTIGLEPPSRDYISHESEIIFPHISQTRLALNDLMQGITHWRIWLMLAYQDIKLRYRRSILGPFWLTLSMAITVYSMGFLYSRLFHIALDIYFPFLVAGMLGWSLISTLLSEFTEGFSSSDGLIKQIKLPYSLYIHRTAMRNILIFFHNILVIIPIMIIFHRNTKINFNLLFLIPGLFIIYINSISFGLLLSMISSRFRDIAQIIKSLIQVIFFITPVMWKPDILGERGNQIISLNPFYAFLELIRAPLLGTIPTSKNLTIITIVTLLGIFFSAKIFIRYRARIIYWL